jgi:hypothetical protein
VVGLTPDSVRARHGGREVSAALTRGESLTVVLHGAVAAVDCADPVEAPLLQAFRDAYGWPDGFVGGWGNGPVWRIEPSAMFAARLDAR